MTVHALATQPHYVAHIAPVWLALNPEERGTFCAMGPACYAEALRLGVPAAELRRTRNMPPARRHGEPLWIVAGYYDLDRLGPRRRAILIEHGTGQTYIGNRRPENYPGGPGRGRVALFLCPNQRVADLNARAYPRAWVSVVGCPHLEDLRRYRELHAPYRKQQPVVTFHFDAADDVAPEARSAWSHYRDVMPALVRRTGLAGHAHPRCWSTLGPWWESIGATAIEHQDEALASASVLIADNTSCLYQAAALGIPVVVLNAPWYRRDVQHGLRFWEHASVGLQVNEPGDLFDAIAATLAVDPLREHREAISAELYPQTDGGASAAAAAVIRKITAGTITPRSLR